MIKIWIGSIIVSIKATNHYIGGHHSGCKVSNLWDMGFHGVVVEHNSIHFGAGNSH